MTAIPEAPMAQKRNQKSGEVLLGEDWVSPESMEESSLRNGRRKRTFVALNHSPLARKIIIFNLMALVILVAGVLFMNPFRDSLVLQRENGLKQEASLIADVFEAGIAAAPAALDGRMAKTQLEAVSIGAGVEAFVFDGTGDLIASVVGDAANALPQDTRSTIITDFLNMVWDGISGILNAGRPDVAKVSGAAMAEKLYAAARNGETASNTGQGPEGARCSRWRRPSFAMALCWAWWPSPRPRARSTGWCAMNASRSFRCS